MTKQKLQTGHIVITRDNKAYTCLLNAKEADVLVNSHEVLFLARYNNDLTCNSSCEVDRCKDIVEVISPLTYVDILKPNRVACGDGLDKILWSRKEKENTEDLTEYFFEKVSLLNSDITL